MYCPVCGLEYREGVTECRDCGVALTLDPPPEPPEPTAEWLDLETVLESSDPARLLVAQSLLTAVGIPCFVRGQLIQDLLGLGRAPWGMNFITGPVQLQVPMERGEEARQLLMAANESALETTSDESVEG